MRSLPEKHIKTGPISLSSKNNQFIHSPNGCSGNGPRRGCINQTTMNVQFNNTDCFVKIGHYFNHNPSIQLMDADDEMPVAHATINVNDGLQPGEVVIKDNLENQGMYQTLLDADIIEPAHRQYQTGFVSCPVSFMSKT